MTPPVKVTVTGAAGQIGYALLFRIASGQLLGPDTPGRAEPARDHAGAQGRRGHGDGARRLRVPAAARHRHHRRPERRLRRHERRAARRRPPARPGHGARRPARGQRRHLQPAGPGDQRPRRRRHPGARRRQPGEHERADRDEQRAGRPARALHRDDAPGPQPRARAARPTKTATPITEISNVAIWGNHSATQYPDITHADDRRRRRRRPSSTTTPGWPTSSSRRVQKRGAEIIEARGASSAASAANAAIDHVHDWVLGSADGDWSRWPCRPTAPTACRRASSPRSRASAADGEVRDRPGPGDRRLLAPAHRRRASPSCPRSATRSGGSA